MSTPAIPWEEVTAGGVRWHVAADCRHHLVGPAGLRLGEWLATGQAEVVKHGPHRTVYRVTLPGLAFYLKHYRLGNTRARLRQLVRPPKARMEYDRALAVAARRVPTVTPLGLGEEHARRDRRESFLVTRTLEGVEPLSTFLEATLPTLPRDRQAQVRRLLARALGTFLARVHDAGIAHQDLHPGNLLLALGPGDRLRFYLADLHDVHLGRPLTPAAARANLVMLNRWFILRTDRTDRLRFWRAYESARPSALSTQHSALETATWSSNLRFWKHRDQRCLVTNRYYERVRSPAAAGYAVQDIDRPTLAALLADPDEPFTRPGVTVLKDSASSTVIELQAGTGRRLIYKRFLLTNRTEPWAALFRRPPALRSWVFGHGLRERCLPTPRPLAVLHRRRLGLPLQGYLLTEKVSDAVDLHGFVDGLAALPAAEARAALRRHIDHVARLVRELHRRQLSHRDLKAANVLVQRASEPRPAAGPDFGPVWLIDLVGVARHRRLSRARRAQNLARLHASFLHDPRLTRTDKLRFLRVYLQWGLHGRRGWKAWWQATARATQKKVARNARSGRPLT